MSTIAFGYSLRQQNAIAGVETSTHSHAARMLLDRRNYKSGVEELKKALHDQPDNRKVAVKLASIYYRNQQYEMALEMVLPFQNLATKSTNLFYFIGRCMDAIGRKDEAYEYYQRAFRLDPTLYKAPLRIAQLFMEKGLHFDAATHLKNLLEINPEYKPAQVEFETALRLIRENQKNTFRRGNMVVTFPDYNLIRDLEEWYPYLQEKVYYLQNALGVKKQVIWVEIVQKIRSPHSPPALYQPLENKLYLTVDTVQRKYTALFTHQLAYAFFHQMNLSKAPAWLKEGIALYFSQPNLIKDIPLRKLGGSFDLLDQKFFPDRRYLNFNEISQTQREQLLRAFLIAKFLIERYGWDNLERFLKEFEAGKKNIAEVVWDVFHIRYRKLMDDFDVYAISNYYFRRS